MKQKLKSSWPEIMAIGFVPTFVFVLGILMPGLNTGAFISPLHWLLALSYWGIMLVFNGIFWEVVGRRIVKD